MALPKLRVNAEERLIHPNNLIYEKMEKVVQRMLEEPNGVPIKTVKSFLSKIPSVFTGADLIAWLMKHISITDHAEALHLAHLLASHGYLFQIDDHVLTVKNDGTFYRFQTPYFWPSNCWEPENTDYAVYLCKRTMQNNAHLELEDFEAENLAKLQKMFSRKWEFVFMQAEAQYKVDKKRDRLERQILDSQERAFWDVHRPVPGCVNTTEVDFRKLSRAGRSKSSTTHVAITATPSTSGVATTATVASTSSATEEEDGEEEADGVTTTTEPVAGCSTSPTTRDPPSPPPAPPPPVPPPTSTGVASTSGSVRSAVGYRRHTQATDAIRLEISILQSRLARNVLKTSKVFEAFLYYYNQRVSFDPLLMPTEPANPWISDTVDLWQNDKITGEISTRRVKQWALTFEDLLQDPQGREILQRFLDKEYSGENLKFWWEVQKLRKCAKRMVPVLVTEIYNEYISPASTSPVNIDCKVMEITEENLRKNPNRWSFDEAADHIFCLMKNDSYQRFLRSDGYKDLLANSAQKKNIRKGILVEFQQKFAKNPKVVQGGDATPSMPSHGGGSGGVNLVAHQSQMPVPWSGTA